MSGLSVLVALCLIAGVAEEGVVPDAGERQFSFSSDPAEEILNVSYLGGMTGTTSSYTLYGDGRLQIDRHSYQHRATIGSLQLRLSGEEMTALLQPLVTKGLMQYDEQRVRREMGWTHGRTVFVSDGVTMLVSFRVESYRAAQDQVAAPAEVTIAFDNPTVYAPLYPEVEEIQALADLAWQLREYKKRAEKHVN